QSLGALLKRAGGPVAVPAGLAERSLRPPSARPVRRPFALIPLTVAAGILVAVTGLQLFAYSFESALADLQSGSPESRRRAIAWADSQGAAVVKSLRLALQDPSVDRQRLAAE